MTTQQPNGQLQREYKYSEQQSDKIKTRDAKLKTKKTPRCSNFS